MAGIAGLLRILFEGREGGLRARWRRDERGAAPAEAPPPSAPTAAPEAERAHFQTIARSDELAEGEVIEARLGEVLVALCRVDGVAHAVSGTCPHAGGPLGDGRLEGAHLVCPYHGWAFDVRNGACRVDAERPVEVFELREEDGAILARLAPR